MSLALRVPLCGFRWVTSPTPSNLERLSHQNERPFFLFACAGPSTRAAQRKCFPRPLSASARA